MRNVTPRRVMEYIVVILALAVCSMILVEFTFDAILFQHDMNMGMRP